MNKKHTVVTVIPVYNQTDERLTQCKRISTGYFICNSISDALKLIILRKTLVCEIWYPHHFWIFLICRLMNIKCVFSPVLCDIEWFKIARRHNITNYLYSLKRFRMAIYGAIAINLAHLVFVQDEKFISLWAQLIFGRKRKIKAISNFFDEQFEIDAFNKCDDAVVIVSHDAEHKIYYLEEMLKIIPSSYNIIWAGTVNKATIDNYRDRITFVGRLCPTDLDDVYRSARILLVPSIFEGSPRVVYESASKGVRVFSSELIGLEKLRGKFPELFLEDLANIPKVNYDQFKLKLKEFNASNIRRKRAYLKILGVAE